MDRERIKISIILCLICFILIQNLQLSNNHIQDLINKNVNLFKHIGLKHGTDKVSTHHYETLYGTHVGPFRDMSINFLEIGIGCSLNPGKSIMTWKDFLPYANIYAMEFDAACAEPFRSQVKRMFTGDQSDLSLLRSIGEQVGHFDVIVDDGGHSRKQQVNSLIGLWPFLRKGGVYVIEDMYHSFVDQKTSVNKWYSGFNDNDESSVDLMMELLILLNDPLEVDWIQSLNAPIIKPNITIRSHALDIFKNLLSINCYKRACVLYKN